MPSHEIQNLIEMWASETITADQAIGQLLLKVKEMTIRIENIECGNQAKRFFSDYKNTTTHPLRNENFESEADKLRGVL